MFTVHFMQVIIYSGEEEEAQESYIWRDLSLW